MNPDEFARLKLHPSLAAAVERQLAFDVLQGRRVSPSDQNARIFEYLVDVFAVDLDAFRTERDADPDREDALAVLSGEEPIRPVVTQPCWPRQTARLPGWRRLVLLPAASLITGITVHQPRDAAQAVVVSCGPRFYRARQVIQAATAYIREARQRAARAARAEHLAELAVPPAPRGPYR